MTTPKQIVVREYYPEPGFARQYYKVVSIDGKPVRGIICKQEEVPSLFTWYTTTGDGDYNEPISEIKSEIEIVDEFGKILRPAT